MMRGKNNSRRRRRRAGNSTSSTIVDAARWRRPHNVSGRLGDLAHHSTTELRSVATEEL